MRFIALLISILAVPFAFAQKLPNPKLTPGAIRTTDTKQICSTTTKQFRHTSEAVKKAVCREYHVSPCPVEGKMEIDHLVPLELGGADVQQNLWVQFAPDFREKDKLENSLHRQVCAGKLLIVYAQNCIRKDWAACQKKILPAVTPR